LINIWELSEITLISFIRVKNHCMSRIDYNEWSYYKKGVVALFPPYKSYAVDKKSLFNHFKGSLYIRWDSDFDKASNQNYYHVIKDGDCTIESLPPKTRNQIRRCLKNCEIRLVDCQYIIDNGGYVVYASEFRRYDKKGHPALAKSESKWAEGMKEAEQRGRDLWAVIYEGIVIAYSICDRHEAHIGMDTWKVDYEKHNHLYPSYGLIFKMCEYYLAQEDIQFIDDGGRSLTEHSGVQDFLIEKFHFRKAYTKLNAEFRWYLRLPLMLLSQFESSIKNNKIRSLVRLYKWSR